MQKNILEYFFKTVNESPLKIAVIEGVNSISFKELDRKSKILSQSFIQENDFYNQPIAVYLPKTIDSVISDIAISYSGNIYMNLDIKTPAERIKNILELRT